MNQPIEPAKTYWVTVDNVRFKVRTVRPSALEGWWLCEGHETGDPLMVPAHVLSPVEEDDAA